MYCASLRHGNSDEHSFRRRSWKVLLFVMKLSMRFEVRVITRTPRAENTQY
jgi:hypothetical protein